MQCPGCGREARADARFCDGCGSPLASTCATCGRELRPDARFCDGCGEASGAPQRPARAAPERAPSDYTPKHLADRILRSRSALEGERKHVTVLFADVKGSMDLAEQIDAEEWHGILDRFFGILAEGIHRFEGTINQYTGDGVMALFGAPVAHEDHAHRACYAALHVGDELRRYARELRLERGLDFSIRMGVNSGEVVVGKIGDDLRMDYTAQGHTVGLAARMQEIAEAGKVYLAADTEKIVRGWFTFEDLGEVKVTGVSAPIPVFELQGVGEVRTRLDVSRSRGLSKFVGRSDESGVLEAALERAIAGEGQVVGVVADAGMGKSRLCFEFAERCRARGIQVRTTEGVAHGRAVPLLPILRFYRQILGITEDDDDPTARQKLAGSLAQLDRDLLDSQPLLEEFLGIPDPAHPAPPAPPAERQKRLLGVLRRLSLTRSEREPAVLLFEDLHWIDDATEVFVEMLADVVQGTRTLLLANFRPEYSADWMRRSYYRQIPLTPLDERAIAEMLDDLLGEDSSLGDLARRIHGRTGGNPFFAEEVVQNLVEDGALEGVRGVYRLVREVDELAIPGSVKAILAARIDRLSERDKVALQTASVIGDELSESLLRRVADLAETEVGSALRELVQAEFLHETALYPETEYAFKHPLTREVAGGSMLRERRAAVHAAVARDIVEQHADRLDEKAALLAQHWEEAGEILEAARSHGRAAMWSGGRDSQAALSHWRRVRELLANVPESDETRDLELEAIAQVVWYGARTEMPPEEMLPLFEQGMQLAEERGEERARVVLLLARATYDFFRGAAAEAARTRFREVIAYADEAGDRILGIPARGYLATLIADQRDRLRLTGEAIELAGGDPLVGAELTGFATLPQHFGWTAWCLAETGRVDEALPALERGRELAAQIGDPMAELIVQWAGVMVAELRGEPAVALRRALRIGELGESMTNAPLREMVPNALGQAHVQNGDWDPAIAALDRPDASTHYMVATRLAFLAEALLGKGRIDESLAAAEASLQRGDDEPGFVSDFRARIARARCLLQRDGAAAREAVEEELAAVEREFERNGHVTRGGQVHEVRAQLASVLGDAELRESELRRASHCYAEAGAAGHVARLERAAAS